LNIQQTYREVIATLNNIGNPDKISMTQIVDAFAFVANMTRVPTIKAHVDRMVRLGILIPNNNEEDTYSITEMYRTSKAKE
jgi:hypothetical protein